MLAELWFELATPDLTALNAADLTEYELEKLKRYSEASVRKKTKRLYSQITFK